MRIELGIDAPPKPDWKLLAHICPMTARCVYSIIPGGCRYRKTCRFHCDTRKVMLLAEEYKSGERE